MFGESQTLFLTNILIHVIIPKSTIFRKVAQKMSTKRRKSRNNKAGSGMPIFQYQSKKFKQIPSLDRNANILTTTGVTNNKITKGVARFLTILFITTLISILIISIAHLF